MQLRDMTSEPMVLNPETVPRVLAVVLICNFLTACGAVALPLERRRTWHEWFPWPGILSLRL